RRRGAGHDRPRDSPSAWLSPTRVRPPASGSPDPPRPGKARARRDGDRGQQGGEINVSERIEQRIARVAIIGQGYVGLPLAAEFARAGFTVVGVDNDVDRVAGLALGHSYTPDVKSEELMPLLASGRYAPSTNFAVLDSTP